jgi:subtilisin family serine protease
MVSAATAMGIDKDSTNGLPTPGPSRYAVQLAPEVDPAVLARSSGLEVVSQSRASTDTVFLAEPGGQWQQQTLEALRRQPGVQQAGVTTTGAYEFYFSPNDPFFDPLGGGQGNFGQWHLHNTFVSDRDINVTGAWQNEVTGDGVTIGVVDDSVEGTHPDLAPNFDSGLSYDFADDDPNPAPEVGDRHGVSVAGLAAARGGNDRGVTGVAPHAGLAGLRIQFGRENTEQQIHDATVHASENIDVKNHSYGISLGYVPDAGTVMANREAAADGVVNVRAAGNAFSNANAQAAQADRKALTVAAFSMDGQAARYSNFGANVFVTAPSNDTGDLPGLTTTDRTGTAGYNVGNPTFLEPDYNHYFGGTSGASPVVAGVVAQVKQVNPNLGVRGVKHVLANTSQKVDPSHPGWQTNGAGYAFNPEYGFGLVDASAATDFAQSFTPPAQRTYTTGSVTVGQPIPKPEDFEGEPDPVTVDFDIAGEGSLEAIELRIKADHEYPGDFELTLESPAGTTSELAVPTFSKRWDENLFDWTFSSNAFWGESLTGQWTIKLFDRLSVDSGTFESFTFTGYTAIPTPSSAAVLAFSAMMLIRRGPRPGRSMR